MQVKCRWLVFSLALLVATLPAEADWPHPRGPRTDGRIEASGTFEGDEVGLALEWRVPLGSAYSGVAARGGTVVTMFADAEADWVAAVSAATGKTIWRTRLGDLTVGHDGSDDGPLSSPVLGQEHVFAVAPAGNLVALRLEDGKQVWQKHLVDDLGAEVPHFGFATTPLHVDGRVVVQAGAKQGRSILAFDAKSGEVVWSFGDDGVNYQSPALLSLADRLQLVVVSDTRILGLSPRDGELLWALDLGENDRANSAVASPAGDDRFVVPISGQLAAFRVARAGDGWQVEELYRTEALGRNYAPPVYQDGHLYGFRGQVLTCADAATGERVWRSRPPGGDGLILVDGHLVIFGAKGQVVVADATPDGYVERARIEALPGSSLTWPSFDAGRIFVRNLEELAAVAITRQGAALPPGRQASAGTEFARTIGRIARAEKPRQELDEFLTAHPTSPVVEGEFVHFFYFGDARDVAIAGSMNDTDGAEPLERVEGTDLFHRTYRLEPGARWEYRYQIDFETWIPDPRNPRHVPALDGDDEYSEIRTAGYREAPFLEEPAGPRGRIETFQLVSEALGYEKEIRVWLPPGYDPERAAGYPLLVVTDGTTWIEKGRMIEALDNLVGERVRPLVVAFVAPFDRWWQEAGGGSLVGYAKMLAMELVPELTNRYRLADATRDRGLLGNRYYGFSAAYTALEYPAVFGGAALQSVYLGMGHQDELHALIGNEASRSVRFYLDWNRYDERNIDRDWDLGQDSAALSASLLAGDHPLAGGEVLDSAGWSGWRNRLDSMLTWLFPQEP